MVKVSVLYPNRVDAKFDMTYYLDHHISMVRELVGSALKGVSVERGISGEEPGSSAPYHNMSLFIRVNAKLSNELRPTRKGN
jgi:uncharacterized protein (TIGR02118 family)